MKTAFIAITIILAGTAHACRAQPATSQPEIRRGFETGGTPEERASRFYDTLMARVEPSGKGDVARLSAYLDFFHRELVRDRRLFATAMTAEARDGVIVLGGYTEFDEHPRALSGLLERLGFSTRDEVKRLPSDELGDKRFAIVKATRTFIFDKPALPHENLTECVNGDKLILLAPVGDLYLCHAPDGYVGYVQDSAIERIPADQFDAAVDFTPRDERMERAIASAMRFIGTKYVWGGTTSDGIDCSGLIYRAFKDQGVSLARDADQQSLAGRMVATRHHRAGLRRGDLLYFLSRRGTIHHTAIYLGHNQFLEATGPAAKISSFDKNDPDYSERRDTSFCFAKRIFE